MLSLEQYVLQWEAKSAGPVRSFGRKSLNKNDRPQIGGTDPMKVPSDIGRVETHQSSGSSESSTPSSYGGSVIGISLPAWGKSFLHRSNSSCKGDGLGISRQVATSSSANDSEYDREDDSGMPKDKKPPETAESAFSPLQQSP